MYIWSAFLFHDILCYLAHVFFMPISGRGDPRLPSTLSPQIMHRLSLVKCKVAPRRRGKFWIPETQGLRTPHLLYTDALILALHFCYWIEEDLLRVAYLVVQMVKNLPAMRETWVQSLGQEDSPREGNGNPLQFSCLGNPMDRWELGGLQSMGSQRVGHNWATEHNKRVVVHSGALRRDPWNSWSWWIHIVFMGICAFFLRRQCP